MGDRAKFQIDAARAGAKLAEAEALTRDVAGNMEIEFESWEGEPGSPSLNAGEQKIAVLQGVAIALGAQAAALCFANKGSDSAWLKGLIVGEVERAFDKTLAGLKQPPATATKQ